MHDLMIKPKGFKLPNELKNEFKKMGGGGQYNLLTLQCPQPPLMLRQVS